MSTEEENEKCERIWLPCKKCGDLRSHSPEILPNRNKAWHCGICGTVNKLPKKTKKAPVKKK